MSEASEAKRMGASLHKNSGRGTKKGDASWEDYVVDYKEFSNISVMQNSSKNIPLIKNIFSNMSNFNYFRPKIT